MNIIKSLINRPKKVINESSSKNGNMSSKNEITDEEILEKALLIANRILSRNITI
ncbi:hypothetical protein LI055_10955 [Clostridium perfringens]|uniref:hypothetical protein n=1 Tax=Clostridium perfringens TaxID=1502 RepID=UPI0022472685|nr:hypothetical protein [Clostridium perfringens]MCX0380139.1 hypothetical protein [Clostridium perfringens]